MKHNTSENLFARAQKLIPGGVNSPVRAFRGVGGTPPFIARGEGSRIYDVDGNEYIDYVGSWGPLILGHRFPPVLQALRETLEIGTSFGAPTEREDELAELIAACVPSIEMVRLVNSGTEATMSALRAGARLHRARPHHQIRRLLSRPCGFAAGKGRVRHGDARHRRHRRRSRRLSPPPPWRCPSIRSRLLKRRFESGAIRSPP